METTSKWHKFSGLLKWSPEIVLVGLPELWTAINPDCKVRSQWGLNQSCSPRRDLFNAMLHTQIGCQEGINSRLLVIGSQIASLTPGPSFAHNLGCRCPNCQCEGIFDIYVSRPFQWHQEHPNARCFAPCCRVLNIRESRRTPNPNFSKCWASPPHLAKVGVRQNQSDELMSIITFLLDIYFILDIFFLGKTGFSWALASRTNFEHTSKTKLLDFDSTSTSPNINIMMQSSCKQYTSTMKCIDLITTTCRM